MVWYGNFPALCCSRVFSLPFLVGGRRRVPPLRPPLGSLEKGPNKFKLRVRISQTNGGRDKKNQRKSPIVKSPILSVSFLPRSSSPGKRRPRPPQQGTEQRGTASHPTRPTWLDPRGREKSASFLLRRVAVVLPKRAAAKEWR